jgi:hypothetical protein
MYGLIMALILPKLDQLGESTNHKFSFGST